MAIVFGTAPQAYGNTPDFGGGLTSAPALWGANPNASLDRLGGACCNPLMQGEMALQLGMQELMMMMQMILSKLMGPQSGGAFGSQAGGGAPLSSGGGGASSAGAADSSAGGANASSGSSSAPAGPIQNPSDFARALLRQLGAPETDANISSIVNWERHEGGQWHNSAHFNPLNTTQGEAGATSMNSVGVKAYTSWDQGLQATVATLNNGRYGDLLAALKSGQGLSHGSFKGLSTWSGGGYSSI